MRDGILQTAGRQGQRSVSDKPRNFVDKRLEAASYWSILPYLRVSVNVRERHSDT